MNIALEDILIRNTLRSGDMGYVIFLHGILYKKEYDYGIEFESYVAAGLLEFYKNYDEQKDRVWICEHEKEIIGFLLLMHRPDNAAQLRYFLIKPEYRGLGLGKKLMKLYMNFFEKCNYTASYLWTTHELSAAAALYTRYGFKLTEEIPTTNFGKPLKEQRYDLIL